VSNGEAYPSRDGREFVEFLKEFDIRPDTECFNTPIDIHQVNVKNSSTGTLRNSFLIERSIQGPIRLSPDGQRMAMKVAEPDDCGSSNRNQVLSVYSTSGDQLFRGDESMQAYDWQRDGRLVIIRKTGTLSYNIEIESSIGSYRFNPVFSMDVFEEISFARGLRISPSGDDIVFEFVTDANSFLSGVSFRDAVVVVVRTVNQEPFRELFRSGRPDGRLRVNTPVFSPDGTMVLVTDNYSAGALSTFFTEHESSDTITVIETLPVPQNSVSYVVPLDAQQLLMPPATFSTNVRPIFAVSPNGGVSPAGFNPLVDQTWTPPVN